MPTFTIQAHKLSTMRYLTEIELHARWEEKVSLQTLRNWRSAKTNKGPAFVKFGQRVLYPADKVEEYEQQALVASEVA